MDDRALASSTSVCGKQCGQQQAKYHAFAALPTMHVIMLPAKQTCSCSCKTNMFVSASPGAPLSSASRVPCAGPYSHGKCRRNVKTPEILLASRDHQAYVHVHAMYTPAAACVCTSLAIDLSAPQRPLSAPRDGQVTAVSSYKHHTSTHTPPQPHPDPDCERTHVRARVSAASIDLDGGDICGGPSLT